MKSLGAVLVIAQLAFSAAPALSEGDLTRRATRLEPLLLDARTGFSITRFELETGVYYRWRVRSDGLEEYKIVAPEFFPQIWVDQVVIDDMEVKPMGLYAIEFDDAGEIDVWFVPIRPGTYRFFAEGLESQGFSGEFVVE